MKLDFYAPKKLYGTHVLAFCGWLLLFFYQMIVPIGTKYPCDGYLVISLSLFIVIFFMLNIILVTYTADWIFKLKVKNKILLNNRFYDFLMDTGISFISIPFFWHWYKAIPTLKNLVPIIIILLAIRMLKLVQNKSEKKDSNET